MQHIISSTPSPATLCSFCTALWVSQMDHRRTRDGRMWAAQVVGGLHMNRSCRISTFNMRESSRSTGWPLHECYFSFFCGQCRSALFEEIGNDGSNRFVLATCVFCSKVFRGLGGALGGSKCSLFSTVMLLSPENWSCSCHSSPFWVSILRPHWFFTPISEVGIG